MVAGGAGVILGVFFGLVYLPRRLRPAWRTERQSAGAETLRWGRPVAYHAGPPGTSSEEAARKITGSARPRLLVLGRVSGLTQGTQVSPGSRNVALWVVPGRVLFVQSAGDDRRLGDSFVADLPAEALRGMRPGFAAQGKPALVIDAGSETQRPFMFEYQGSPETLARHIREALGTYRASRKGHRRLATRPS